MAPDAGPKVRGGARLARSSSAYLRAAAGQEIDWYPWGPEPFELARRTNRPILLDIGAAWCHWCHVMDETTYADPEVVRQVHQGFVAVKVDRDEHPEIDRRYQQQVGALTGEGGWPLTGFLTLDGQVFLGGTYFPPTADHGRPGFRHVLSEVARLWKEDPGRVRENARAIQDALRRMRGSEPPRAGTDLAPFVDGVGLALDGGYDPAHAGFGTAPKFPHPVALQFLLYASFRDGSPRAAERAKETLLRMADGGLYDQLGGGFHRYSVDEGWHIPHFEKMGVDNAELLSAYVEGLRRFGEPRFEEVVRGVIGWADEVLRDPAGGWGSSQDADNAPGDDGSYFTWSRAELRAALDPSAYRLVSRVFGVDTDGRMPHDPERNVLFRLLPVAEAATGLVLSTSPEATFLEALATLRSVRARRPAPVVDRALYANINGRFLGAYAVASQALGEPALLAIARQAADRWLRGPYAPDRGLPHQLEASGPKGYGMLDDQVAMARGLLELSIASAEPAYLTVATELLELVDGTFRDATGLLRDLAPSLYDGPKIAGLEEASYPLEDSPHLSANAGAALAFVRLGSLLHEDRWLERARTLLRSIAVRLHGAGLFAAGSALASGLLSVPAVTVVVEGSGPAAARLLRTARRAWHPNLFVFEGRPPPPFSLPEEMREAGAGAPPRALVCRGSSCGPPLTDPDELVRSLAYGGSPAPPGT